MPDDWAGWRLYRAWGWHQGRPDVLLYVGMTGQPPWLRLRQHIDGDSPWVSMLTAFEAETAVHPTQEAAEQAEAAAIREECPVYNVAHNDYNPRALYRQRPRIRFRARMRRRRLAGWAVCWAVAAVIGWLVAWKGFAVPGEQAAGFAVGIASMLVAWGAGRRRPRRRSAGNALGAGW